MSKDHEQVLCVPTKVFGDLNGYESLNRQGFNLHQPSARVRRLRDYFVEHGPLWKKRGTVEEDTAFQQLIPYVVVTANRSVVLAYTRGKKGAEKRLHAKKSIGVGGHINRCDIKPGEECDELIGHPDPLRVMLYTAAMRELKEELQPTRPFILRNLSVRGFVRTSEAVVAKVHVGIVFEYRSAGIPSITPAPEIVEPTFLNVTELRSSDSGDKSNRYEQWSYELFPALRRDFAVV